MSRILIRSKTSFTDLGKLGVGLFILSPVAGAFCSNRAMFEATKPYGSSGAFWFATGICGVLFLTGIVLLLIGKETVSEALSGEDIAQHDAQKR